MYDPQPIQEKDKLRAWQWYEEHRVHVDKLVANCDSGRPVDMPYPPSGSDCIRPELWKGCHWKWLLEVTCETCGGKGETRTAGKDYPGGLSFKNTCEHDWWLDTEHDCWACRKCRMTSQIVVKCPDCTGEE